MKKMLWRVLAPVTIWLLAQPVWAQEAARVDGYRGCFTPPTRSIAAPEVSGTLLLHVIVDLEFLGGPADAPRVRTFYSNAPASIQALVHDYVRDFRMLCRRVGSPPHHAQQAYVFKAPDRAPAVNVRGTVIDVSDFIASMKFDGDETVFDFDAMSCPFELRYTFFDHRKMIDVDGHTPDALVRKRMPLIRWLHAHYVNYASPQLANELVGQYVNIHVPCGTLQVASLRHEKGVKAFPP